MRIKSVKLENIRSYLNESVTFPEGSVLLSGDIGSGKSTILLAIEFALFGILKGTLHGETLLRNGKSEGSVELRFEIEGRDIVIKRNLKRTRQGVQQTAGYIMKDSVRKDATAVELKTDVLDMLGYPKELVTKSKSLVYRYTVYTPQEEMRLILAEDREARMDTLRKVFDIDKYKRIKENITIYSRRLKSKKKELEGFTMDLEDKKREKREKEIEKNDASKKIEEIMPLLKESRSKVELIKTQIKEYEEKQKRLNNIRREISVLDAEIRGRLSQIERNNEQIKALEAQVSKLQKELKDEKVVEARMTIKEKESTMQFLEDTRRKIMEKLAEFNTKKRSSDEVISKISKLDNCPLCLQKVDIAHKKGIIGKENEKLGELNENIKAYSEQEQDASKKISEMKKDIDKLREIEKRFEVNKLRLANIAEKQKQAKELSGQKERINADIGKLSQQKLRLNMELENIKDVEEDYQKMKSKLDDAIDRDRKLEIQYISLSKEREGVIKIICLLDAEVKKRDKAQKELGSLNNIQNWLEEYFANLVDMIEKHVMNKVHGEFNEMFQKWFSVLIEDETITARIDDTFTPIVIQNGYENDVANLSGGERTSCALAYRLALNKVINDIISTIKTKDIIILDEPTDGFSTEQLDKVRDVLEELGRQQVIIVSHESKIESFVDNIIKISKNEHISTVVSTAG
jgi:exonuclease SbcC